MQLRDPVHGGLVIECQHGFGRQILDFFSYVDDAGTACGTTLARGSQTFVDDVETSPIYAYEDRQVILTAGVRSVLSTALRHRTDGRVRRGDGCLRRPASHADRAGRREHSTAGRRVRPLAALVRRRCDASGAGRGARRGAREQAERGRADATAAAGALSCGASRCFGSAQALTPQAFKRPRPPRPGRRCADGVVGEPRENQRPTSVVPRHSTTPTIVRHREYTWESGVHVYLDALPRTGDRSAPPRHITDGGCAVRVAAQRVTGCG